MVGIFDKGAGISYQGFKLFSQMLRQVVSGAANSVDNGSNGYAFFVNFRGPINPRGVGVGFNEIPP